MTLLLYRLTEANGERPLITESFATRYEALSRLDELLRQHQELCSVEVVRR